MKLRHMFLYIAVVSIPVLSSNIAWAQTAITGCTTITHPGSYVLKNNITATAAELKPTWLGPPYGGSIVIAESFVTIDLSGYLITGPELYSVGIAQDRTSRMSDVVKSGSIHDFCIGVGLSGAGHTVQGVNASNGCDGIYINDTGNHVIGNTANYNAGYGIVLNTCGPNIMLENMATGNTIWDIYDRSGCTVRQDNFPAP